MLNAITVWNIYQTIYRRNLLSDHLKAQDESIYFCGRNYGKTNVREIVSHNARFSSQRPIATGTVLMERRHFIWLSSGGNNGNNSFNLVGSPVVPPSLSIACL